jgi:5-methylcytosine-specific restriction endonuclease McrA
VEEAVKRCPHCRKDKPEGIFHGKKWCPECLAWSRAYLKAYRTNPEVRAASRAYDKARYSEPEKGEAKKAYQKARRANPEKKEAIKVYMNAYRSDPEKKEAMKTRKKVYDSDPEVKEARKNFMKTYNHAYLKTPAGKLSAFNARCKRRDSIGFTTLADWLFIQEHFNRKCAYCASSRSKILQREHVIPVSSGGVSWLYNLVPACKKCNNSKHNSDWLTWFRSQPFYCAIREAKIQAHLDSKLEHTDRTEFPYD